MVQFYFLSIVFNALAGYILISEDDDVLEFKSGFSLKDDTFKFVVGILSAAVGLLKILSAIEGDVRVIGDLFPAASGLLTGFILIFEHYRSRLSHETSEQTEKIEKLFGYKKIIGVAAFIAAALHFLFPKVLLL